MAMKNAATKMGQSLNIRRAARKRRIVGSGANGTSPSHRLHGETGAEATCSKPAESVNGEDASRRNDYDLSKNCFIRVAIQNETVAVTALPSCLYLALSL